MDVGDGMLTWARLIHLLSRQFEVHSRRRHEFPVVRVHCQESTNRLQPHHQLDGLHFYGITHQTKQLPGSDYRLSITMRSSMRFVALLIAATIVTAFQIPRLDLQPFFSALPLGLSDYIPTLANLTNNPPHDLLRRQYSNTCPTDFNSCSNLGAVNLCCAPHAVCSADFAGNVACCPSGSACSGTIAGIITVGTVNSNGDLVGATATTGNGVVVGGAATTTATTTAGLVAASTQTTAADTGTTDTAVSGSAFIVGGTAGVVATPAAAIRAAQIVSVLRG